MTYSAERAPSQKISLRVPLCDTLPSSLILSHLFPFFVRLPSSSFSCALFSPSSSSSLLPAEYMFELVRFAHIAFLSPIRRCNSYQVQPKKTRQSKKALCHEDRIPAPPLRWPPLPSPPLSYPSVLLCLAVATHADLHAQKNQHRTRPRPPPPRSTTPIRNSSPLYSFTIRK